MRQLAVFILASALFLVSSARDNSGASYRIPLEVLRDPGGQLTLDNVRSASGSTSFRLVGGQGYTGGYTRDAIWFRFQIEPFSGSVPQLFLEIQPPYLDDIQFFFPDAAGEFQKILAGDIYPFSKRLVKYRSPVITIPNPGAPITAYIRLQTSSSAAIFLQAWTPAEFYESSLREYMMIGAYIGVLILFMLMSMTRRGWLRQQGHIYHVIYIFAVMIVALSTGGLLGQYLWPDSPWLDQVITPASILGLLAATTLYYGHLFGITSSDSALLKIVKILIFVVVFAGFVSIALDAYVVFLPYIAMISAGSSLLLGARSLKMLKDRTEDSKWIIAGWLASVLGFLMTALTMMGSIPGYSVLLYAYHISTVATIFNYRILMNIRIDRMADAEQQARAEALRATERFMNEKRISELQSRFLAMIHHELRTPLSIIRLALGMKNASPKVKIHAIDAVHNIDSILERCALSQRLDHAQIAPKYQDIDVLQLLSQMTSQMPEHKRIQLHSHSMTGTGIVRTDPEFLVIMLRNLLENAFKYATENSAVLITVTGPSSTHDLCITITNQIEHPEEIDTQKIFERYVRTPSASRLSGSGLGLYIAKGLADSLRAEINCFLDENKINFRVCL